jgi:hypothetical protein
MSDVVNIRTAHEVSGLRPTGSEQTAWFGLNKHDEAIVLILCPKGMGRGHKRWSTAGVFVGWDQAGRPQRADVRYFESNKRAWPQALDGSYMPGGGDPFPPERERALVDRILSERRTS